MRSTAVPLPIPNIDTDQIIPAEFLKATARIDFGKHLFHNWRYLPEGRNNPGFILNDDRYRGQILVTGNNFGCGSSREHAAWALADYGFKAIISSQFADIFKGNALKNRIIPVELDHETVFQIMEAVTEAPETEIQVDLEAQEVTVDALNLKTHFDINPFYKECILQGVDETQYLISMRDTITEFEKGIRIV